MGGQASHDQQVVHVGFVAGSAGNSRTTGPSAQYLYSLGASKEPLVPRSYMTQCHGVLHVVFLGRPPDMR